MGPELRLRESVVCPDFVAVVTWDDRVGFATRWSCCCCCCWSATATRSCACCGGTDCRAGGTRNRGRARRGTGDTLDAVVFPGNDETVRPNAGVQHDELSLCDDEGVGDEKARVAWLDEVPLQALRGCAARGYAWRWDEGLGWRFVGCCSNVSYAARRRLLL